MTFDFEYMPNYLIFKGYKTDNSYYKLDSETIVRMDKVVCVNRYNNEISITIDTNSQASVYKFTLDLDSAIEIMDLFKHYLKDYYSPKEEN